MPLALNTYNGFGHRSGDQPSSTIAKLYTPKRVQRLNFRSSTSFEPKEWIVSVMECSIISATTLLTQLSKMFVTCCEISSSRWTLLLLLPPHTVRHRILCGSTRAGGHVRTRRQVPEVIVYKPHIVAKKKV